MKRDIKLTEEDEQAMREEFEKHPGVVKLRQQIAKCMSKGDFFHASQIQSQLSSLLDRARTELYKQAQRESENLVRIAGRMTDDERTELVTNLNMLFVLADMIDSCTMDFNSTIHKYEQQSDFLEFANITELGQECKRKIKFLGEFATMPFQLAFGTAADDITTMVRNKVRSLIRKTNKNELA